MPKKYHIRYFDFFLVAFAIALAVYGIFVIGSARASVQSRQMYGLIAGLVFMLVLSFIVALRKLNYQTLSAALKKERLAVAKLRVLLFLQT